MLGKLQRAHHTLHGHYAPAYLVGSNKLRAYLSFIYTYSRRTRSVLRVCHTLLERAPVQRGDLAENPQRTPEACSLEPAADTALPGEVGRHGRYDQLIEDNSCQVRTYVF